MQSFGWWEMGFVVIVVVVFVVVVMQIGIARLRQLVAGSARRTGRVGWKMAAARSKVMIHSRGCIRTAATEASGEEEVPGEDVDMYVLGGMSSVGWLVREGGRMGGVRRRDRSVVRVV
jgi:hypothetical protein